MSQKAKIVGIRWVTKRELRKVLNTRSKRVLGLSGDAFQKRLSSGKLGPLDGTPGTLDLATLCSFTGGKSAGPKRKRSRS